MLNEMEARLFWEAYENGASDSQDVLTYMLVQGYGVKENAESFLDKIEEYAKVNLGSELPRGNEVP